MKQIIRCLVPIGFIGFGIIVLSLEATSEPYNETTNYTYDSRGRLIKVDHSGSVNNNLQSNYSYDKTNNRTTVNVTGSPY
jgi:YD repeat-containing protein